MSHTYNGPYTDEHLSRVAFPLGGMGAGMICLEGSGALAHVSVRGKPELYNEPLMFAALCIKGESHVARVLEGPVPRWKVFGLPEAGNGLGGSDYGLPRFSEASFIARFPFGVVKLRDDAVPLDVELTGWSPFIPGDPDASSLPVAALEYCFHNLSDAKVEAVFSFHARNFMQRPAEGAEAPADSAVGEAPSGFILWQPGSEERPWEQGAFSVTVDDPDARVNCAWFRGGWFDALTMVWKSIEGGEILEGSPITEGAPSPGGSVYVPLCLDPGERRTLVVRLAWHVPHTDLRIGNDDADDAEGEACCACGGTHTPWYAGVFADVDAVTNHWRDHYADLRRRTVAFTECFYDTTLPDEVVEAIAANLTILKSPTVQRQTDGRLWCWEGCCETHGCCHGSCTHVWNYAQALPHLFPSLERTLRETEFFVDQDERGHQAFRASLPIRPPAHDFHAAADGQLGGIMKVYREWRISGDELWLRRFWPKVRQSLDYCIETWDPDHLGVLVEPHHNTYDIEFWGPDGMCTSFYLGALKAATPMAEAVGDEVPLYEALLEKGVAYMQSELWDGEYFIQRIQWEGLRAEDPTKAVSWTVNYSPEAEALLREEGPKYQYGKGCLSDGVLGAWIAAMCGVAPFLDADKVRGHLMAVYKYNLKHDLRTHANPQRPTFALGEDGGLLLCTWPKGGALSLPFVYSNEVWTGIEYQVAAHLMLMGEVEAGLEIVRVLRDRYDGRDRNPFDEYECGHWYARAMASYGMIQGLTGVRYDAVEGVLYVRPRVEGDFRAFLATASGFGNVGVRNGNPFVDVRVGEIPYREIVYTP
ncbi:MAG: GH116 family glycosyl hydrolase [Anaerolineae bacterium]